MIEPGGLRQMPPLCDNFRQCGAVAQLFRHIVTGFIVAHDCGLLP